MASTGKNSEFYNILNCFDDVSQLLFYARSQGLENDPQVIQKLKELKFKDDFGRMLQNFTNIPDLLAFAKRNNLFGDPQVKQRLALLKVGTFTNAEQLVQHADQNGIGSHPAVIARLEYIVRNASLAPQCGKCSRVFHDFGSRDVHQSNCGTSCTPPTSHSHLNSQPSTKKTQVTKPTFVCHNCDKTFTTKRWCHAHQEKCLKGKSCIRCQQHFSSLSLFAQHKCSHHLKCQHCEKAFPTVYHKQRHENNCRLSFNPQPDSPPSSQTIKCNKCSKTFKTKKGFGKHVCKPKSSNTPPSPQPNDIHNPKQVHCNQCKKTFKSEKGFGKHVCKKSLSRQEFTCGKCRASFTQVKDLKCHQCIITCRRCKEQFISRHELFLHIRTFHRNLTGKGGQVMPDIDDPKLRQFYLKYRSFIQEEHEVGTTVSAYNFPVSDEFTLDEIDRHVNSIFDNETHSFKLNLAFGFILQHAESRELRYFKAYTNDPLFDLPIIISSRQDLEQIRQRLEQMDITAFLHKNRPNTKWRLVLVTNVRYFITSTHFPLGQECSLPQYISNQKSIVSLTRDGNCHKYHDNLCLFRCLTYHRHANLYKSPKQFEKQVQDYIQEFSEYCDNDLTDGVDLNLLPEFEKCFNIDINVFCLHEDGTALPVFKSTGRFKNIMYLNLYQNHLSYIKDVKQYCKKYQCPACKKLFNRNGNCKQHMKTCNGATKYVFPGGYHQQANSIFDELEEVGIHVQHSDRFYNYFIVYDFESYLKKLDSDNNTNTVTTAEHIPISVSICSNVPGYTTPHCIIQKESESLVKQMLEYMDEIQATAQSEIEDKLSFVMEDLESQLHSWQVGKDEKQTFNKMMRQKIQTVLNKFKIYCSQIPVLGFNSSKYDINLIKKHITKALELHDCDAKFVVKKNNAYSCIANENFKFLDVLNFLAAGSSYAKFLKAFGVEQAKGMFCYEYFDSPDKLEETSLPPHEAFYSELKDSNITPEDYDYLKTVWRDNNMKTLKDFLIWYNNLDVGPFVEAVEKLQSFYQKEGIDIFKTAISVPGIARQMVFQSANEQGAYFSLIDKKNSDLYFTMLSNIVGGPSLIFHRYAEAGKTFIRGGSKKVKKVVGFDANALYLWAFDQEFPVGAAIRRHAEQSFKPEYQIQYDLMYFWMDFISKKEGIKILHKKNFGKEKRDGRFLADGYCAETNTIYQFDGCFFHKHTCQKTPVTEKEKVNHEAARKRTEDRDKYYKSLGYNVRKIYECDFRNQIKSNPELKNFVESQKPKYYKKDKKTLTEAELLEGVRSGELFGALEVDIHVPDHLKEQFAEMCPLFCTTDIPFDAIGSHMQTFTKNAGLNSNPRRLLVGALKATKMLIATPLLKWYLEHGLVVTKIHQVVEYGKMRCFRKFVKNVSDARRSGDVDSSKAIIADLNKLVGNSAYGSMIMNKLKHSSVEYVEGDTEACKKANEPTFKAMTELSDNFFEIEMQKKRIKLDLPIQIGYMILQYAKLKMLQFYFDFLCKFVDKSDFQMLQMDTDSLYFSISGEDLGQVIKPHLKADYDRQLTGLCSPTPISGDDHYFPRACCSMHAKYDCRTPGLFKLEYSGDLFYGLCSKTYIVQNGDKYKFSSKGISKNRVQDPLSIYKSVLESKQSSGSTNVGFIAKNNSMFTYKQHRQGFSYFYCKRKVMDDGITTEPLDITVQPIPSKFRKLD